MATAMISTLLHMLGVSSFSGLFFVVGTLAFLVFIFLFLAEFLLSPREVLRQMTKVETLFTYFTFSAAASGLAVRFCLEGNASIATFLGVIGAGSCILLIYSAFCLLLFSKVTSIQSVSPYWLLMGIATNYVGIIITTFWEAGSIDNPLFLVTAFCFWSFGVAIYMIFMALNLFRMFFMHFEGKDINPSYWTCIGAAAIAVVDGSNLASLSHAPIFLTLIRPFIEGMNIFLWGWATAWFPILLIMELWKYFRFRIALEYTPALWAMVFPLAMYTAATELLTQTIGLTILHGLVQIMLWVSLLAWGSVGLLALMQTIRGCSN